LGGGKKGEKRVQGKDSSKVRYGASAFGRGRSKWKGSRSRVRFDWTRISLEGKNEIESTDVVVHQVCMVKSHGHKRI
jgi:hypothetical protein